MITDEFTLFARFSGFLNQLNEESLVISLDNDFIHNNNTITSNSNLIEIAEVRNNINIFYDRISVNFLNEFLDKSQFENQEYTFTLSIETKDGLQFEKQISKIIDL